MSAGRDSGGIFIAVGANLGDRAANIAAGLRALEISGELAVVCVSSLHESKPVGGPVNQPWYLNGAAELETGHPPRELLDRMLKIEVELGRSRSVGQKSAPRTLDLDLLVYRDLVLNEPGLIVPHPRMWQREFVLRPLAEICDLGALRRRFERTLAAPVGRERC